MTNKEAIENITSDFEMAAIPGEHLEAYNMAIKALEVLDHLVKMSDADGVYYACPECAHEFRTNATVQTNFTAEELREAVARVDIALRPYAIVCNPKNAEFIKKAFENKYKIVATPFVEEGKAYLINREQFEKWEDTIL